MEIGPGTVFLEHVTKQVTAPGYAVQYTTWPKAADEVGQQGSLILVLPLASGGQVLGLGSTNFMVAPVFVCFDLVCKTWELAQSFLAVIPFH